MLRRTAVRWILAGALLVLCGAHSSSVSQAQTAGNYVIGPQDVLMITVLDDPTLTGRYTVEADGDFTFPLIGRIKAGGLSTRDFESSLKKKLSPDYFKNPQLTVAVEQYRSQRIFVSGEVRVPGPVPLTGGMTLAEALARAGSTLASASGELAIIRQKQTEPLRVNIKELETGNVKQNLELQDGDQIYVLRAESAFVFGEVRSPGAYSIPNGTTILQALALAGGVTPNGALNRIKVSRMENGKQVDIKVKETELSTFRLKAGDTVIVPEKYF